MFLSFFFTLFLVKSDAFANDTTGGGEIFCDKMMTVLRFSVVGRQTMQCIVCILCILCILCSAWRTELSGHLL